MLFEDEERLAVDKPPGRLVIAGRLGDPADVPLVRQLEEERGAKLWVVHRLDRHTSGVLLFAKTARAHRALSIAFEKGAVKKEYWAFLAGRMPSPREVNVALVSGRKGRMRPARAGEQGKEAVTRFEPLELLADASWVLARPLTGRTHQIRVHAAGMGHPLLADPLYGKNSGAKHPFIERTPLHAARLFVPASEGSSALSVSSPMPDDMQRALTRLR